MPEISDFLSLVYDERQRQLALPFDTEEFDKGNTQNDWVAYIIAYAGRATDCQRNIKENQGFKENLVKVAALCQAASDAIDKGYIRN